MSEEIQYRIFRLRAEYETLFACIESDRKMDFIVGMHRRVDHLMNIRLEIDELVEKHQPDLR